MSSSILLLLSLTSSFLLAASRCNHSDMTTLLQVKNSFGNPSELSSWGLTNDCCTSWRGIGCNDQGRVTSISVFSTNVSGTLPPSISSLSALTIISLLNLPNLTGTVPKSLTKLASLSQITISLTSLSGGIPSFLCKLSRLSYVDLSNNNLVGIIPDCLGLSFTQLDLSGNQLSGSIPPTLLTKVAKNIHPVLRLSRNQFGGHIPKSFSNVQFDTVDLSHNRISGDASMLFGARGKKPVRIVDLSWNELNFYLSRVKFSSSIGQLDLSHNKIWGRIPQQMAELKKLYYLDLSYNRLCGRIPALDSVNLVKLNHNKCLCGSPPLSACRA